MSGEEMRSRWEAIHVHGETVTDDCGCTTNLAQQVMCAKHWDWLQNFLNTPDDPAKIERMARAFRTTLGKDDQ